MTILREREHAKVPQCESFYSAFVSWMISIPSICHFQYVNFFERLSTWLRLVGPLVVFTA